MELEIDDLMVGVNVALNFVAGFFGVEFGTVYNLALCVLGVASLYAARKTGRAIRWSAVKAYRVGKRLASGPELSELGNAILKHMRENSCVFDEKGILCSGTTRIYANGNRSSVGVKVNDHFITHQLTTHDLKVLLTKYKALWDRWNSDKQEKERRWAMTVLNTSQNNSVIRHFPADMTQPVLRTFNHNPNGAEST